MKKSESIGAIAKAMAAIQKEVKPLEKSAANPFTDSKYTPLDKIVEAIFKVVLVMESPLHNGPLVVITER